MIRTERLLLRRWQDADREPFAALNADAAVVEHLQGPMSRERSDDFVNRIEAHWDEHGWGLWAVEAFGAAPFIGYVGLAGSPIRTNVLSSVVRWARRTTTVSFTPTPTSASSTVRVTPRS